MAGSRAARARERQQITVTAGRAQRFTEALARRLGVDPGVRQRPRTRTRVYYLQREHQLPVNVDPGRQPTRRPDERERLRRVFERGLGTPVGYVLPLQRGCGPQRARVADRTVDAARAASVPDPRRFAGRSCACRWKPAVVATAEDCAQCSRRRSDGESAAPLPVPQRESHRCRPDAVQIATAATEGARPHACDGRIRAVGRSHRALRGAARGQAVCLHAAGCRPRILDLLAAIEDTAAHLKMPVVIEGYTPPYDPRIAAAQGHARPRRDRSQHPSRRTTGTNWSPTPPRFTSDAARAGWAPKNSCSTAGTPAPAAATTSCWAAATAGRQPVPAPARPAAQHDRLLAESSRRSPICFRACSSAPPARRRASTNPAGQRSTNWRSRSARFPNPGQRRLSAVAGGSHLPPSAGRRDRQHASRRILHR